MNEKLFAARIEKGWSQEEAAEAVGVAPRTYQRWEHGDALPNFASRRLLHQAFGATDEELGFHQIQREEASSSTQRQRTSLIEEKRFEGLPDSQVTSSLESGIHRMKEVRRQFLQHMFSTTGALLALPYPSFDAKSWERLSQPHSNEITLRHLETITKSHWQLFLHVISKSDLLSSSWGHLQTIMQFLKSSSSGVTRNRLCSLVGESAQIIGEIFFDMQEYRNAEAYYHLSIEAAKEAGDNALRAVGLGRLSFLPIYRNEPQKSLPLLEEAYQLTSQCQRSGIVSWLAVVEAEAMSNIQNDFLCEKALEKAERIVDHEITEQDLLWTRWNNATLSGYKGVCYVRLQQPSKALPELQTALTFIPSSAPRHQSIVLTDVATALLQLREVEEACRYLRQAVELTTQTQSLMVLTRISQVRNGLERWKDIVSIKALDERIAAILPHAGPVKKLH